MHQTQRWTNWSTKYGEDIFGLDTESKALLATTYSLTSLNTTGKFFNYEDIPLKVFMKVIETGNFKLVLKFGFATEGPVPGPVGTDYLGE